MRTPHRPPDRCIFCGTKGPLTDEHIFGKWFRPRTNMTWDRSWHFTDKYHNDPATGEKVSHTMALGKLHRPGMPHEHQLKLVCKPCNSGWMSKIQEDAKPHILELANGVWPTLTKDKMLAMVNWATMVTMCFEFADVATMAIPAAERKEFMDRGRPGDNWVVCFGLHSVEQDPGSTWHRAAGVYLKRHMPKKVSDECNVQTTTTNLGRAFFQTLSYPLALRLDLPMNPRTYGDWIGVPQFWPPPGPRLHILGLLLPGTPTTPPVFDAAGMFRIATQFWSAIGMSPKPHGGAFDPAAAHKHFPKGKKRR